MSAPRKPPAKSPPSSADPWAANVRPRGLGGWLGALALTAMIVETAIVILYYLEPSAFSPPRIGARYGYAFIGSLIASVTGGFVLMIRQNNPWWLLTLPWAVAIGTALVILAGKIGLASMH